MKQRGFTIVELLIVIVVIAILAAISIVAYNGVQTRAKVTIAKTDLQNMAKQMEIFKIKNGHYPSASQVPRDDLAEMMKAAGVYQDTRANQIDWGNGVYPAKRFAFCTPNEDDQRFAIVVDIPILRNSFSALGETTYYVTESKSVQSMVFTEEMQGNINGSLCTKAGGTATSTWHTWSNSVPASWAQ